MYFHIFSCIFMYFHIFSYILMYFHTPSEHRTGEGPAWNSRTGHEPAGVVSLIKKKVHPRFGTLRSKLLNSFFTKIHPRAGHLNFRSFPRLLVGPKTNSRAVSAGGLCFLYKKKFPQGRAYAAPLSYSRFSYFLVLSIGALFPKILSRAGLNPRARVSTLSRSINPQGPYVSY